MIEGVGWHHRLDGHEFEQALGLGDGQGSPVCCSPLGRKSLTQLSLPFHHQLTEFTQTHVH